MKKYDNGGSVLTDSEGRPVRFGYESDEEYEKRARPTMTALQMEDVSPSSPSPAERINKLNFFRKLFGKPFSEKYREIGDLASARSYDEENRAKAEEARAEAKAEKARAEAEKKRDAEARPFTRPVRNLMPARGFAKGGKVGSASKRADGIAMRGKTRGRYI